MTSLPALFLSASLALSLGVNLASADNKAKVQGTDASEVRWQEFDQGIKDAARRGKYTFVDLYTDWCGYCHKMDATTFRNKAVIASLDKDFVSIKFNAEAENQVTWKGAKLTQSALAQQWGVEGFPTLLFLNSKGDIIGNFSSYADPKLMMHLLGYISSGSREKGVSFDDYLKKGAS